MAPRAPGLLLALVLLAGCVSGLVPGEGCQKPLPEPPERVTERSAKTFAETYEAAVAHNRICEHDEFGLDATVASKELAVEMRTADGFYVFARQPYWVNTERTSTDGASSGMHFIGNGTAVRVSQYRAEQLNPQPYAAGDDSENVAAGQEIRVFNFENRTNSLGLTLRYLNATPPDFALNGTYTVDGTTGVSLREIATRTGSYELTVEAGTGERATYRFTLTGRYPPDVVVYVGPDGPVRVEQAGATR